MFFCFLFLQSFLDKCTHKKLGPQARIAEQVDQWSAREAKDDLKKKQLSMRDKSEEARKKRPGRKDKWKKTM